MVQFSLPQNSKILKGQYFKDKTGSSNLKIVHIYRWNPEKNDNPREDTFEVDIDTCGNKVLDILNKKNSEIKKAWELNERHYGALTGLNKDEMMKKHGKKQVHIWRRSFDVPPPPMEKTHPNHPSKYKAYINIPTDKIPDGESLKNTFDRVIPYYEENIKPLLSFKKNILISAHGNSLRALCKKLLNISNKKSDMEHFFSIPINRIKK